MRRPGELETELLELGDCSLSELLAIRDDDIIDQVEIILRQIVRPRANLGGAGPPGRAD